MIPFIFISQLIIFDSRWHFFSRFFRSFICRLLSREIITRRLFIDDEVFILILFLRFIGVMRGISAKTLLRTPQNELLTFAQISSFLFDSCQKSISSHLKRRMWRIEEASKRQKIVIRNSILSHFMIILNIEEKLQTKGKRIANRLRQLTTFTYRLNNRWDDVQSSRNWIFLILIIIFK